MMFRAASGQHTWQPIEQASHPTTHDLALHFEHLRSRGCRGPRAAAFPTLPVLSPGLDCLRIERNFVPLFVLDNDYQRTC